MIGQRENTGKARCTERCEEPPRPLRLFAPLWIGLKGRMEDERARVRARVRARARAVVGGSDDTCVEQPRHFEFLGDLACRVRACAASYRATPPASPFFLPSSDGVIRFSLVVFLSQTAPAFSALHRDDDDDGGGGIYSFVPRFLSLVLRPFREAQAVAAPFAPPRTGGNNLKISPRGYRAMSYRGI